MTAAQLVARAKKREFPPMVLLLGQEAYERRRIKEAMTAAFAEGAVAQLDLNELSLAAVLDDARALSLFASERLVWVVNAEAVLPKTSKAAVRTRTARANRAAPPAMLRCLRRT